LVLFRKRISELVGKTRKVRELALEDVGWWVERKKYTFNVHRGGDH